MKTERKKSSPPHTTARARVMRTLTLRSLHQCQRMCSKSPPPMPEDVQQIAMSGIKDREERHRMGIVHDVQ